MDNSFSRAKGPSNLRNEGGMLSGPAAPLPFIFLILPKGMEHSFRCQHMVF